MTPKEIAQTILAQLGGQRFIAMTGVSKLAYKDSTLYMRLPRNASAANRLSITLDPTDTYTMRFFYQSGGTLNKKTLAPTPIKEKDVEVINDVYCDQLAEIFEHVTGMYTSL